MPVKGWPDAIGGPRKSFPHDVRGYASFDQRKGCAASSFNDASCAVLDEETPRLVSAGPVIAVPMNCATLDCAPIALIQNNGNSIDCVTASQPFLGLVLCLTGGQHAYIECTIAGRFSHLADPCRYCGDRLLRGHTVHRPTSLNSHDTRVCRARGRLCHERGLMTIPLGRFLLRVSA